MENVKTKTLVGTVLCIYFGSYLLGWFCTTYFNQEVLNYQAIVWIVADLICCAAMGYLAFKPSIAITGAGRTGAVILALLNLCLGLNMFMSVFATTAIFSFLGVYFSPVVSILELQGIVLLIIYGLKVSIFIEIFGALFFVLKAAAAFLIPLMSKASDIAEVQRLMEIYSTLQDVALIAAVLTVIVTIVWMFNMPKSQQVVESKKEEII